MLSPSGRLIEKIESQSHGIVELKRSKFEHEFSVYGGEFEQSFFI